MEGNGIISTEGVPCLLVSPKAETKNKSFLRRFIAIDIQVESQMKDDQAKLTFGFCAYSRKGKLISVTVAKLKAICMFLCLSFFG